MGGGGRVPSISNSDKETSETCEGKFKGKDETDGSGYAIFSLRQQSGSPNEDTGMTEMRLEDLAGKVSMERNSIKSVGRRHELSRHMIHGKTH